jgi:AcrR family transcriptional regulator
MVEQQDQKKRKNLPQDQRREMILDAALVVFARDGYDAADVDDIALEAEIGKGTIYRQYPSKRELFEAVVDRGHDQLLRQLEELRSKYTDFEELLRMGLEQHVDFFISNPDYWRILKVEQPEYQLKPDEKRVAAHQRFVTHMVGGIERGIAAGCIRNVDPVLATYSLMSMAAVIVEKHLNSKRNTRKKDILSVLDIFLRGIQK